MPIQPVTMVFHFVAACGATAVLTAVLTVAACRDRRKGWVRRRSDFMGELMADWAASRSLPLPDVDMSDSVVRRQPALSLTSDLIALNRNLGQAKNSPNTRDTATEHRGRTRGTKVPA